MSDIARMPTDPFGVPRCIVMVGTRRLRPRYALAALWLRIRRGAALDLRRALLNGAAVVAVFDHQPSMEAAVGAARQAGVTHWMLVSLLLSDDRHVYIDEFAGPRPDPVEWDG